MAKKKSAAARVPKLKLTVTHVLTILYSIAMFSVFPLFLTDYYQSARRDKFWFFVILTSLVGAGVLVVAIVQYSTQNSYQSAYLNVSWENVRDLGTEIYIADIYVKDISCFKTCFADFVLEQVAERLNDFFEINKIRKSSYVVMRFDHC